MNVNIPTHPTPTHAISKKNKKQKNTKKATKHPGALQRPWQLVRWIYYKQTENWGGPSCSYYWYISTHSMLVGQWQVNGEPNTTKGRCCTLMCFRRPPRLYLAWPWLSQAHGVATWKPLRRTSFPTWPGTSRQWNGLQQDSLRSLFGPQGMRKYHAVWQDEVAKQVSLGASLAATSC